MPFICSTYDCFQFGMDRTPSKLLFSISLGSYKRGRVSLAATTDDRLDFFSAYPANHIYHFPDARAFLGTEIKDFIFDAGTDIFYRL